MQTGEEEEGGGVKPWKCCTGVIWHPCARTQRRHTQSAGLRSDLGVEGEGGCLSLTTTTVL